MCDNHVMADTDTPEDPIDPAMLRVNGSDAFKIAVCTAIGQQGGVVSLHSSDPGTTGAGEISGSGYARQTTTWGAATVQGSGPDAGRAKITGSTLTFNVPGNTAIAFYGVRKADGTYLYGKALQPGATLTAAGTITITPTHAYGLL